METIEIELIRIFTKVVQFGGFSKAANHLNLPKSTVSKAITKLEAETGTKLLLRNTRTHTLTSSGRAFYETCIGPIQTLEEAQRSLYGQDSILSGIIKITAPEDMGAYLISPIIGKLSQIHPRLKFELHFSNQLIDLIKEGFDLAVRIGNLQESLLRQRRIGHLSMILVASPQYLKSHSKIKSPEDLIQHECLTLSSPELRHFWYLKSNNENRKIKINSRFQSNHMTALINASMSDAGIVLAPQYLCQNYLERNDIVRILPEWSGGSIPVSLLTPHNTSQSGKLRVVSDELVELIKKRI